MEGILSGLLSATTLLIAGILPSVPLYADDAFTKDIPVCEALSRLDEMKGANLRFVGQLTGVVLSRLRPFWPG